VEPNSLTEVIEGEDGVFRIGRVTEAQDDKVDELYQTKMQNEGIDLAKYREVVRGDVIRTKLEDKIVADVTKPGPQRQVSEIYIPSGDVESRSRPSRSGTSCSRRTTRCRTARPHRCLRRSGLGEGQGRRRCCLREAEGEPRAVRRDGENRK
jgi:hypothetical protein